MHKKIDDIYCGVLAKVLEYGTLKSPTRGQTNVTPTIYYPHLHVRYDMSIGFPLLTIKKMPFKSVCVELEGFLQGITDKSWFMSRGCHFWDHWQSPAYDDANDLGPLGYSWQWRRFNDDYYTSRQAVEAVFRPSKGDQLLKIVETLKNNPYDRRMVCSAWNPLQIDEMALPPCHVMSQFYVNKDKKLSCHMYQRSVDVFLGLPFNIASYALLTHLIAQVCDLRVGELIISTGDTHIYNDHIEQVKEQLTRDILAAPALALNPEIKDITKFTMKDINLLNYTSHGQIKANMAV